MLAAAFKSVAKAGGIVKVVDSPAMTGRQSGRKYRTGAVGDPTGFF